MAVFLVKENVMKKSCNPLKKGGVFHMVVRFHPHNLLYPLRNARFLTLNLSSRSLVYFSLAENWVILLCHTSES